ncbi:hypothetical protein U1Q18_025433, partial [Sarracenia purpurea var. burkii]
ETDQMINGEGSLIIVINNAKNSVGHRMDVIGVVIVVGQGQDTAESSCVDGCKMTPEVGPEIAHDGVAFEDGSEGLELVARSSIEPLQTKKREDRWQRPPTKPEVTPSEEAMAEEDDGGEADKWRQQIRRGAERRGRVTERGRYRLKVIGKA